MRKWITAVIVLSGLLAGCVPAPDPATKPAPGDNTLRIEVHAYSVTPSGDDVIPIRRIVKLRLTAENTAIPPQALLGDDDRPLRNWSASGSTPWKITLSQKQDSPHRGIGVSLRVRVQELPGDEHINLVCQYFVNGVEDLQNADAGVGPEIVCLYRTGFSN